jgi:4a-hydroxytetrahydrobiopterin dehydratase
MERKILGSEELSAAVAGLDHWAAEGSLLKKRLEFANFAKALAFVNKVAELAESADHHPDIAFGWGYVELLLTTHDRGGVTDVDISLAKQIDAIK